MHKNFYGQKKSILISSNISTVENYYNNSLSTLDERKQFTSGFLPILLECWIECSPIDQLLHANDDELKCMELTLHIIYLLFESVDDKFIQLHQNSKDYF